MSSESDMPSGFLADKARNNRCNRLEIKGKMGTIVPGSDKYLPKKARILFKEVGKESSSGEDETFELKSEEGVEKNSKSLMSPLRYGSISLMGRSRVMEDAVMVLPGLVEGKFDFFAVYDGHGGSKVANACRERLHYFLEKEIQAKELNLMENKDEQIDIDWEEVMLACFAKMDEQVLSKVGGGQEGAEMAAKRVGSTALVAVVGKEEVAVANCGDSRAVLCRDGVAMPLSHDHKPDRSDEKERVEAAGGTIINWNGSRVLGVLAITRSIGDHYLRPYVISEPEVTRSRRTESDEFLILATDGVWDVISNDLACNVVRQCLAGRIRRKFSEGRGITEAAAVLAELAIAKGSTDNISVIVVDLKKNR